YGQYGIPYPGNSDLDPSEQTMLVLVTSEIQNSQGELIPSDGLSVDLPMTDNYEYDWGDPRDPMIRAALEYLGE
ncbi:MAG: hypothetical protein PF447_06500, partial [Spirochaetaceae bacterium]|nr:hypothetical protein [Spirochaetaceae bacterium]